jgi:hypothetical protein
MAKKKVSNQAQVRNAIQDWKAGNNQTDELYFDPTVIEERDQQLWAFTNQSVLVDIQNDVGPFKKFVFVAILA